MDLDGGRVTNRNNLVKGPTGQSSPTNAQVPLKDEGVRFYVLGCGRRFLLAPCRKNLRSAAVLLR